MSAPSEPKTTTRRSNRDIASTSGGLTDGLPAGLSVDCCVEDLRFLRKSSGCTPGFGGITGAPHLPAPVTDSTGATAVDGVTVTVRPK